MFQDISSTGLWGMNLLTRVKNGIWSIWYSYTTCITYILLSCILFFTVGCPNIKNLKTHYNKTSRSEKWVDIHPWSCVPGCMNISDRSNPISDSCLEIHSSKTCGGNIFKHIYAIGKPLGRESREEHLITHFIICSLMARIKTQI